MIYDGFLIARLDMHSKKVTALQLCKSDTILVSGKDFICKAFDLFQVQNFILCFEVFLSSQALAKWGFYVPS